MFDLRTIARALGGEVVNGQVLAPGPNHSKRDRSLAVRLSAANPDGFTVFSHAGDDFRACRDHVRRLLGLPNDGWKKQQDHPAYGRATVTRTSPQKAPQPVTSDDDEERTAEALRIWNRSRDLRGTIGERYLASRGLDLPDQIAGDEFLRWNDDIHALVGLFRDVWNWSPRAVTRIYVDSQGRKIRRAFLGPVGGAAVMVEAHGDITHTLTVAEGVETALAAAQMGFRGCWALGSAGGIQKLRLLPGVTTLTILAEPGGANATAVEECSDRWRADGRRVIVAYPEHGHQDMNDVLAGRLVGKGAA